MSGLAEIAAKTLDEATLHSHLVEGLDKYLKEYVEKEKTVRTCYSYAGATQHMKREEYPEFLKLVSPYLKTTSSNNRVLGYEDVEVLLLEVNGVLERRPEHLVKYKDPHPSEQL